jgi:hypothetical protein
MLIMRGGGAILMACSLILGMQSPTAAQSAYRAWVACSLSKQAPSSHSCPKGSKKAAFFESRLASVQYRICVRFPNDTRLCANAQDGSQGKVNANPITSTKVGEHVVTWYVDGEPVRTWTFRVTRG